MLPIRISPSNVAVLIVDLQKDYCDPASDAAKELEWDRTPMEEICKLHVPFVDELRKILPASHIIWARMEEHEDTIAPNLALNWHEVFTRFCVRGTPGFDFHIVSPIEGEMEVFKTHPSAFHIGARVHPYGLEYLKLKNKLDDHHYGTLHTSPINLDQYLKQIGVETVVFTGVLATRCVYSSIVGASIFGYNCVCLPDLIAVPGRNDFKQEAAAHEITRELFYAISLPSHELLKTLREHTNVTTPSPRP